jgi:hypothetical protein
LLREKTGFGRAGRFAGAKIERYPVEDGLDWELNERVSAKAWFMPKNDDRVLTYGTNVVRGVNFYEK